MPLKLRRRNNGPLMSNGRFRSGRRTRRSYPTRISRSLSYAPTQVHRFKRYDINSNVVTYTYNGTDSSWNGSFFFQLSNLSGYTEFTNLFDLYRIDKVKMTFIPQMNQKDEAYTLGATSAGDPRLNAVPPLITAYDPSDVNNTTNIELLEYSTAKIHNEFKAFTVVVKPKVAMSAYQGAFTGYASMAHQWLDCNSPNIQHYGVKWASFPVQYTPIASLLYPQWDVSIQYFVSFKFSI